MDNQFSNIPDGMPDGQIPEPDIFKEQPQAEPAASEDTEGKSRGAAVSLSKEGTGADQDGGYGQITDTAPNMSGSAGTGGYSYGAPDKSRNNNPYQSQNNNPYQNPYNQNGTFYGNGQPQSGYSGNHNPGYQSNYIGVPNAGYQPNNANSPNSLYNGMDTSPMSMGDWLLTLFVCMIPCAGIVLSIIWAFGKHGNVNRRNFCRAQLIIVGVVIALYIIVVIIMGVTMAGALSTY